jgi:hypothetical protein
MAAPAATTAAATPERTWLDRVYAALPVVTAFFWLVVLYAWQAWNHRSPWLFTDELELTQLSRSIADTGHAARRGQPHFFQTLYAYVTAPAWWLGSTTQAYTLIKYLGVFTMTAVVFPTYLLARTIVRPPAALFAAVATAATPALAYSPMILGEPLAYPWAALCFWLCAKAIATRTRWWIAGAVVVTLIAPLVRAELAVIAVALCLGAFFFFLTTDSGKRWRSAWTAWDWIGAVVLATGVLVVFSAVAGNFSESWLIATGHYRHRMIEYGLWAAGAFTIGLGVLPVVAALAGIVRPKDEERTPELRAFTALLVAALISFGLYTAVKASYLSTAFGTVIVERNLIYLAPLVFVGMALWIERPRIRWVPLAVATGFVAYLLITTPYALDKVPYSDALGLAIAQMANRNLALSDDAVQWALVVVLAVAVVLLALPRLLGRRRSAGRVVVVAAAVLVLAWTMAGEISAAKYSNDFGKLVTRNYPRPLPWLDEITGGEPAIYLGQNIDAGFALGIWLTEFWNKSLKQVWSIDGTAPGPGPVLTPDLVAVDGRLSPDPGVRYVVAERGVDIDGTIVGRPPKSGRWFVYRLNGPLRLAHAETGVFVDGWMGAESAYNQYASPGDRAGNMVVRLGRWAWGGPDKPSRVVIKVGTLVKGADKQPHIGKVTAVRRWVVHSLSRATFVIPTPRPPFRVEVRVSPTFSPSDYKGESDQRQLGAQVGYLFIPRGSRRPGS